MSVSFNRKRFWALLVMFAMGCGDDEPRPGGEGGSSGNAGTSGSGGGSGDAGSGGAARGGAGGGKGGFGAGGGATTPPCPNVSAAGAGAGGAPDEAPEGAWCSGSSHYCFTPDSRTCVCTQSHWLCFGGPDPIDSTSTVLTGSYRGSNNQACLACAQAECLSSSEWACERSGYPAGCLHLLACELESGCPRAEGGVKSCYCGTRGSDSDCLYTDDADGVCLKEESTTFTSPLTALTNYFNVSAGSRAANTFARCLADNCASCFKGDEEHSCPDVVAFSVESPVTVGNTAALSDRECSAVEYVPITCVE